MSGIILSFVGSGAGGGGVVLNDGALSGAPFMSTAFGG